MKKILTLIIISISITSCSESEIDRSVQNNILEENTVWSEQIIDIKEVESQPNY